ncbi:hypothetical protein GOP47_0017412 [Adiantum capillus-veneris]|uniref:LysM domain-containing protein n=1 Tax=Adiantum capillus-veneris TaxID=13818 RepID=A0A9D4UGC6_ADICA|nr:hypothetical protein GOP47_0017412 [Adiantum capillus-veneris]
MPSPTSGSKPDEQLTQEKLQSFFHPRISSTRDAPQESNSMLSRRPASDPLPKQASKEPPRSAPKVAPSPPSSDSSKPPPQQEKKGFWNWRPFRSAAPTTLTVDTPQRFHVLYCLHVHSIENLPTTLDGLRLIVHWNRQEEGLQTMPSRVLRGVAEFDENLRQRCSVFGFRNSNSLMQYEPKLFTLSVVALDADELELGKHHIDLSRLLPEEDVSPNAAGQTTRSWSTSFELSGMAKGSSLFVTFSYDLLHQETSEEKDSKEEVIGGSIQNKPSRMDLSSGVAGSLLSSGSKDGRGKGFMENAFQKDEKSDVVMDNVKNKVEDWSDSKETWDSQPKEELSGFARDMSPDLDEEVDLVAGEFLNMLDFGLDSDGEPDSPRARLLRQFEYEGLFGGELDFRPDSTSKNERGERYPSRGYDSRFGTDELARSYGSDDGLEFNSMMEATESELHKAAQGARSKSRAQELEDEETQVLMQRWGMNESAFRNSPSKPVFGPPRPPSLGKGLGSVLYLEDGGSLRSMSSSTLPKNSASGSLVMQSSKPVVVPSTMGSNAVDVLRHLASLGTDTLAKQAMTAMPLQDITGVANEAMAKGSSQTGRFPDRGTKGGYDDYVSLEDLAPLAMSNVEALAVDGLKIQVDVAEEEAPSYLDAAAWGVLPELKKREKDSIQFSHDVAGLHFENLQDEDIATSDAKESGPLSMALTLEEWSKLDAGILDDDVKLKERSLAILAAHNADLQLAKGKGHSRKRGNMGNTLMIAMLVQLRDPLQNFEPVGAPMLTLIQAERVMLPPKPRMSRNVSVTGNSEVDDELAEKIARKEEAPQFKLTGVHMSGLKTPEDDVRSVKGLEAPKKGWGSQKQLQSGSRWLAAQGMTKGSKPSLLKGKAAAPSPVQTKVKQGETLWSISSRVNGSGHKWRDLAKLNPHIRNPDVIFANENIRTSTEEDMDW